MRGNSKHGYHRHHSNKHYKKQIVRVLLDSGSDGDLVFVNKDKPMLLPYLKRLVPQSWNTSNGIFQTKRKARVELNFFNYSNSKWYYSEPDVIKGKSLTAFQEHLDGLETNDVLRAMLTNQKAIPLLDYYLVLYSYIHAILHSLEYLVFI